jgi:magnesium-transporting ATPase (P-type)
MCTGDNLDTAIAISKNAGIVTEEQAEGVNKEYTCTTGKDFRSKVGEDLRREYADGGGDDKKDDKDRKFTEHVRNMFEFGKYHQHLRVLARSSPLDKRILVTGIQALNGIVAVTGDGTNDAPALKKADVGFSMGITGTDIAKGASDIILLDDDFTSIVVALKYGRNVYDSVRKFLQFQLSVNVTAMAIVFFGSCILSDSPLNAVQMLWVNLVMDTFGALALATEPPMESILDRPPYPKSASIVNEVMWRNIFGHAIFQIIVLALVIFIAPGTLTENYWVACMDDGVSIKDCTKWNPYYTSVLYYTETSK